tara:strand:- start:419 stop:1315 length:897 start_codon:yes stop_codon:yes gene_type:complete
LPSNFLLLVLLSAIWGSAFFAIKIGVETISPITLASSRLIIAAIILYIYFKFKKLSFNLDNKTIFIIILIGALGNFIPFLFISWSEQYIKSNTTGLLMSIGPIFAIILAHYLTKDDKFTYRKFLTTIVGLFGVILIIGFDSIRGVFTNNYLLLIPKLTVIIAVLGYVISSIIAYNLKKVDTITLTTLVTISAAIISFPFMLYNEIYFYSKPSLNSIFALIYLGIFPTAFAFLIRFYIISKAGPIYLSYVSYLIPGFAIIWGYIFLNESISIQSLAGLLFILIGIYISQKNINEKNTHL